ncbi:MAG: Fur family transcriptional regulator [bacterium]
MAQPDIECVFRERGITLTAQRRIIARTLFSLDKHIGAEELYSIVHRKHPRIGLATVYRTLQLLKENGLIEERDFGEGWRRYENVGETHHDHLVCLGCGNVIEFDEPAIEKLQDKVARENNFTPISHRLELYGYCERCEGKSPRK